MVKTHSQKGAGRKPRLSSLLEHLVADYIKMEMELPGIVSISHIDVASNMQFATIWISVYGADEDEVRKTLIKERYAIRKYLTEKVVSKYMPELRFKIDPSESHADIISRRLKNIND